MLTHKVPKSLEN